MTLDNDVTNFLNNNNTLNNIISNNNLLGTFKDCVLKAVENAAGYVIKSMPVTDHVKDVLLDVKNSFRSKEITELLNSVVKSSVKEGMEISDVNEASLNGLQDIKNISKTGGLICGIKNVVEIAAKLLTKNKIVGNYVYKFFDVFSKYIQSSDFLKKLGDVITRLLKRKDKFMENVNGWYKAYSQSDMTSLKYFADELKSSKDIIKKFDDCNYQSKIIDKIMNASKKEKLSEEQLQLCMQV